MPFSTLQIIPEPLNCKTFNVLTPIRRMLGVFSLSIIGLSLVPTASYAESHSTHEHTTQAAQHHQAVKPNKIAKDNAIPTNISSKTEVAVSNYPLFLLSEAVSKGAPSAKLLLDAGDIGHHGSLSPGDIKTVKDSRYVVWFGKALETNLAKPLAKNHNSIALFDLNAFHREPLRDVKGEPISGTLDPHIWLDPENAKAITRALGAIYSRANPKFKDVYAKNVQQFAKSMDAAVAKVTPHSSGTRSYWAYHDAFQYIEPTLNLNMAGALTTDHHLPPKASQFHWLKQHRPQQKMCILLQSDSNKGVLSKLQPISSTVQQEDMSHAKDFVSGWLSIAQDIEECLSNS